MAEVMVRDEVLLAPYTTFGIGGHAQYFIEAHTPADIETATSFATQKRLPLFVLGGGSNVLCSDNGFRGVVLHMNIKGCTYKEVNDETVLLRCGAGEMLDEVIADAVSRGYAGLENLSAIPGTVGATPVQNVGAYGVEIKDLIESVTVYDCTNNNSRNFSVADCKFGYRDSIFKQVEGQGLIVTTVTLRLSRTLQPKISYKDLELFFGDRVPTLADIRAAIISIRSKKFPDWQVIGTAGSFFKNPFVPAEVVQQLQVQYPELPVYETENALLKKVPLGFVLDKICGLKGIRKGKVGLYEAQALVLVAEHGATAHEVIEFSNWVIKTVKEKTAIDIEREVQILK